jgi:hypothetical protein
MLQLRRADLPRKWCDRSSLSSLPKRGFAAISARSQMNAKNKSKRSGPTIRTWELVPAAGNWRITCERPGCRAIDDVNLHETAPAPPCRRCCNPSSNIRFLAAPAVAPPGPTSSVNAETPAPETPSPRASPSPLSLWGWRGLQKDAGLVEVNSSEEPIEVHPAIAEPELTLIEKLAHRDPAPIAKAEPTVFEKLQASAQKKPGI